MVRSWSGHGQVPRVALCISKVKVPSVSQWVSESVTRSPIELFWTAKKHLLKLIRSWKKNTFDIWIALTIKYSRFITIQIQWRSWMSQYCNITVIATFCCWEWYLSLSQKFHLSIFWIFEWLDNKNENHYYSTTRSSSKIFRVGYE